jgi:putative transposase
VSCGDFGEALTALLGTEASGFSASTIRRLLECWQEEYRAWRKRPLTGTDYVYIWAEGLHFRVRLREDRLACLIIMVVREDGRKEIIAIEDGYGNPRSREQACCVTCKSAACPHRSWPRPPRS